MSVRVHGSLEGLMTEIEDLADQVVRQGLWCPALGIWYSGSEALNRAAVSTLWQEYFPESTMEERSAPSMGASLVFYGRVLEELRATLQQAESVLSA